MVAGSGSSQALTNVPRCLGDLQGVLSAISHGELVATDIAQADRNCLKRVASFVLSCVCLALIPGEDANPAGAIVAPLEIQVFSMSLSTVAPRLDGSRREDQAVKGVAQV
jgi:hypothetical protein